MENYIRFKDDDINEVATNLWQAVFYSGRSTAGHNKASAQSVLMNGWRHGRLQHIQGGERGLSHVVVQNSLVDFNSCSGLLDQFGLVRKLPVEIQFRQKEPGPENEGLRMPPSVLEADEQQDCESTYVVLG